MDGKTLDEIQTVVESGSAAMLRSVFAQHPDLVNYKRNGRGWLSKAVYSQDIEKVKALIDLGIDVNQENQLTSNISSSALNTALDVENLEITRVLLKHGANPTSDRHIIGAIVGNKHSLELVQLLEEYGADIHEEFVNEHTGEMINALSTAVDWGKEDVVEYLRSRGCVMPGQPPQTAKPAAPQSLDDEVVEFFQNHFGPVRKQSLVEIVPTEPAIAVHVIPSSKDRDRVTLFTTGMSSEPMNVASGDESFALGEIFIELPGDWPYQQIDSPEHGWPIHWLRWMAKAPHQHDTALGPAMIVTRQKRPQPIAPGVRFDGMLLLAEREFQSNDGETVRLYRMTPLYPEERKLGQGNLSALMRAFDAADVSFVYRPDRLNVALGD